MSTNLAPMNGDHSLGTVDVVAATLNGFDLFSVNHVRT